jgi:hypothetical protein
MCFQLGEIHLVVGKPLAALGDQALDHCPFLDWINVPATSDPNRGIFS